jgi:hypothetical protein
MSPELEKMARRAALPIEVWYRPYGARLDRDEWIIAYPFWPHPRLACVTTPAEATRRYREIASLVASLETESAAPTSLADNSAGCSASLTPSGVR